MGMGSSRPNWARRLSRTSGGTFGLVASSSKGSPGAMARMTNRTRLIPARTGRAISRRRIRYLGMRGWPAGRAGTRPAGRPLHGIHLALGRAEELVVLLVLPARDVFALPLVVLRRDLARRDLQHKQL